jgi:nucleoside-diphosphate-sugar epimerase
MVQLCTALSLLAMRLLCLLYLFADDAQDLLGDAKAFDDVFAGAACVFHTASPFLTPDQAAQKGEDYFVRPAVDGTLKVLQSCHDSKVPFVVLTSSTAAVFGPRPAGHVYTEADWNDVDVLRSKKLWYLVSKTLAEKEAWRFVHETKNVSFQLGVINPCMIGGRMLQPSINASSELVLTFINGSRPTVPRGAMVWVDVADVASAHILVYERHSLGRHLLIAKRLEYSELCTIVRKVYPEGRTPTELDDGPVGTYSIILISTAHRDDMAMRTSILLRTGLMLYTVCR